MIPVLTDLRQIRADLLGGSVAVGNFDGVHRGHASLIRQLVHQSRLLGSSAIVLTFDPPPIALLNPELPLLPPITTIARRAELLTELGVDALIAFPTNDALLELSPVQFFEGVLLGQLQIRGMVEGPNFRFGKDRTGDTKLLAELCSRHNVTLKIEEATEDADGLISSSRVRTLLASGDVAGANAMLTQPFRLSGIVAEGAGRGRQLGFPTANLTRVESLIPAHGVYGGVVRIEGQPYRAAVNLGPNPTFGEHQTKIEIHVPQWQGDLYGHPLSCELHLRVRGVKKFESKEALLEQIRSDVEQIQELIAI